jgi:hypothetical protein
VTASSMEAGLAALAIREDLRKDDRTFAAALITLLQQGRTLTAAQIRAASAMMLRYGIESDALRESDVDPDLSDSLNRALGNGVRVSVEDGRILLRSPYKYKDAAKAISGARWSGSQSAWSFPATLTCAQNVFGVFGCGLPDPVYFSDEFEDLLRQADSAKEAQKFKTAESLPDVPNSKTSAWLHQRQAFWFANDLPAAYLGMEMGTGKAQPLDEAVLTPSGWSIMGALRPGDSVVGSDGRPTEVLSVHERGRRQVWEVEFSDGVVVRCCGDHLWDVATSQQLYRGSGFKTVSTSEIDLGGAPLFVPSVAPVAYDVDEMPPLPIPPYLLGALLGDGSLYRDSAWLTSQDEPIRRRVAREAEEAFGLVAVTYETSDTDTQTFGLVAPNRSDTNILLEVLRNLGLAGRHSRDKFIPEIYLRGTIEERLNLLRGLVDTDGHVQGGHVEYISASRALAEGVIDLVRSLGGRAVLREKIVNERTYFRVGFKTPAELNPAHLPRKADLWVASREPRRRIVRVEATDSSTEMRCITVDNPDGLYVTTGFSVTHNSKVSVDLLCNSGARNALILCPVSVLRVWPREFRTHAGGDWDVVVLDKSSGKVSERRRIAEDALKDGVLRDRRVAIVINYEAAAMKDFADWAMSRTWDFLVLDESHRVKAPNGQRSKFVAKLATRSARRLCLSGTPMPQTPLDIWAQFRVIDPHIFGSSFHKFKHVYALWGGYEQREFLGMNPFKADEFEERLAKVMYRATADVLDLPEDRDVQRLCTLSKKASRLYSGIKDELHGVLVDEEGRPRQVSMDNVLTKLLRMQQITGGAVNDDDGGTVEVDSGKADLLKDVLSDIDSPTVVFCRFVHDLDQVKRVATELGRNYGELSGRQNDLDSDAKMPDWCEVMAVQIQAGGVGIDLTRANYGIYYSVGYALGDYLQSRARLVRPGQESEVLFIHLVAAGTIDEEVYEALSKKQQIVDVVLEAL